MGVASALPLAGWARPGGRALIGLGVAVVAGAAVLLGRLGGVLEGAAGLGLAVLLVLAVPTSRELSRRVLLAGCVVLGWVPVAWWLPLEGIGRVTVGLVVLAAALGAWVGSGDRPLQRLRSLVPRWRAVDLLLPVVALVGLVQLAPWLRSKSSGQTLGILFDGWDNSAHFAMVAMIRRFGATADALPAPAFGGRWQFDSYPQGFHAVVAALVELRSGPVPGDVAAELLAYSQAGALVVIVATAVVVAGLCAVPALRRRPAVAVPVAAFVMAVFYVGPASTSLQGGIGNFTVACTLVIAVALVALAAPRPLDPGSVVAAGGAIVGVMFSWVLLLAMALPAALIMVLPLRRWRASSALIAGVVTVAVGCCLWRVLVVLGRVRADSPLTITSGAVSPVDVGLFLVGTLGTIAACATVTRRRRGLALTVVPVAGLLVSAALVAMQFASAGRVSYYGYKFMLGVEIVTLVLLLVPIVYSLKPAATTVRAGAASVVLAIAVSQVFGFTVTSWESRGLVATAPGAVAHAAQVRALDAPPAAADIAERVARLQRSGAVPSNAFYVDTRASRSVDPILMCQWYFALTSTWTAEANDVVSLINGDDYRRDPTTAVRTILAARPDAVVLVPREALVGMPFDARIAGI